MVAESPANASAIDNALSGKWSLLNNPSMK